MAPSRFSQIEPPPLKFGTSAAPGSRDGTSALSSTMRIANGIFGAEAEGRTSHASRTTLMQSITQATIVKREVGIAGPSQMITLAQPSTEAPTAMVKSCPLMGSSFPVLGYGRDGPLALPESGRLLCDGQKRNCE